MRVTLLSYVIFASCATVVSSVYNIQVDYPKCYSAMTGSENATTHEIKKEHFLPFLKLYGPPGCFQETSLTLEQLSVFNSLACLCQEKTNDTQCCYDEKAFLNVSGADASNPTQEQSETIDTICTVAANTIHSHCPDLFVKTPAPGGPSSPPAGSPTAPTNSAPSSAPQSPSGGNIFRPSLRPVRQPSAPNNDNSTVPTLAPAAFNFSNATNFTDATNVTDAANFTGGNMTALNSGSGGDDIPWWVWLLLALLLLLLLLCCLILFLCCCRNKDEKDEEGVVTENGDGASGENDDDDGNVRYRDGVPGEDDEMNNRLKRGSGEVPDTDGYNGEGVNLNNVGGRGGRGNGDGGDGQTFEPYDSSGNYRRGENGDGDGDGYKYKGDWDRLKRGGDGDDGGDGYQHYPGGKRLPGEDGENAYGVNLRPTETRSGQVKKDNDDDTNYPGTMEGYNPYDGGAHYDPHDPYGNGYNREGRDKKGSDDWKNKYQRGEKDGADEAAAKKVREEKPLGPGEIWGVLGEDDGQRSGDKWGPLWVYEKTLDSLKNAEDKGDLDHSSDEE